MINKEKQANPCAGYMFVSIVTSKNRDVYTSQKNNNILWENKTGGKYKISSIFKIK